MRSKKELLGLSGTSSFTNQWKVIKDSVAKAPPKYDMHGLIAENRWAWIKKNIASLWKAKYKPYPFYRSPNINNGIFKMQKSANDITTVALLSDWASYSKESQLIAQQAGIQDYSIHLGDTYYVGNDQEIAENFNTDLGGTWPYGRLGSFAMLGNHEMYSSGKSYFTQLLPYMGAYTTNNDLPSQVQQASFFCLENEYWRIIGLDTGYNSLTGILGLSPNQNLSLTPEQKVWLQNTVNLNNDKRGIIVLSHHQCFSAFEREFPNPAKYISSLMVPGRDIIWLWGHEHWFSVYGPNKLENGSTIFARCIGNSGMPVELYNTDGGIRKPKENDPSNSSNCNLIIYDQREREIIDGKIHLGHNGYVILTLHASELIVTYFDDNGGSGNGRKALEETWMIDIQTGKLTGKSIVDFTINGNQPAKLQLSLFGKRLVDAISV